MLAVIERFVLWALCVAAVGYGLWFGVPALIRGVVGQHDQLVLSTAAGKAQTGASTAETADASQAQTRCSREAAAGVRTGAAISRIAAPRPVTAGKRPMVGAAELTSIVQPPVSP